MIPEPLHPAVIHLPLGLAAVAPIAALLAALAIGRGALPTWSWLAIILLQGGILGSGYLAMETGEREEERVERIVAESRIEAHEESAERLLAISAVALVLASAGLLPGVVGGVARGTAVAATLAVLAAGIQTGHSGGELVYRHGAANAYLEDAVARGSLGARGHHDDD